MDQRYSIRALALCAAIAAGPWPAPAVRAAEQPRFEFGLMGGALFQDSALGGDSVEPTLGLRTETMFSRQKLGWFVDALASESRTSTFRGDSQTLLARTGFDFFLNPPQAGQRWFVSLGGGYWDIEFDTATDYYSFFTSVGVGQRVRLAGKHNIRWELRADYALAQDGLLDVNDVNGQDLLSGLFLISVNWGAGRRVALAAADADGDAVADGRDRCPATPAGATVDSRGCPADGDGDGVLDGLDRCPDSAPQAGVDESGCVPDADADGVADAVDACPATRRNSPVDARGCMLDADGDGIDDKRDMCAATPRGVVVSVSGCPLDSDGDGVYDGLDRCPETPHGRRTDSTGCVLDGDGDGVEDNLDRCPVTPAGVAVDEQGCTRATSLFEEQRSVLVLSGVTFETNADRLSPDSFAVLDRVAASLQAWPDVRVEVGGHTDDAGAAKHNEELSRRRAEAVRDYLLRQGVAADQLVAVGYGESRPVADNTSAAGRARNRRVELRRL